MLRLTRMNFEKIKSLLLRRQKEVEEELKTIKDPVMSDGLAESSEPGTDSWIADVHNQTVAIKENLSQLLSKIRKSLTNLRTGKYGKCENCGRDIEPERLEAIPIATLCLSCSKKAKKK